MVLNRWLFERDRCPLEPFAAAGPIATGPEPVPETVWKLAVCDETCSLWMVGAMPFFSGRLSNFLVKSSS